MMEKQNVVGWFRNTVKFPAYAMGAALLASTLGGLAMAQGGPLVLERAGRTIALEPYAPNILRVTMSIDRAAATGAPGYGFVAKPSAAGWTHERDAEGNDVYRSARMVVRLAPGDLPKDKRPQPMPLDALNLELRHQYFGGGGGNGPQNDAGVKGYRVSSIFDSPQGEHYYGLGQQQKGWMDLRDHEIRCWHDYVAIGGQDVCVPFMVSSRGYGLVWDNPSKTTVDLGFNGRNLWSSEVGNGVSYCVFAGERSDELYERLRVLTGITDMLPRAIYGYSQRKAIYPTQEQVLDIAKEYRERKLPLDVLVVDFLN